MPSPTFQLPTGYMNMNETLYQIKAILDKLASGEKDQAWAEQALYVLTTISNQKPIGKIFRSTGASVLGAGRIILRSNEECEKLNDNDLWEEIGFAWSGPAGYGSLPRGFLTTTYGMHVDVSEDIIGISRGGRIMLGTGSALEFIPIVTLHVNNPEDWEPLMDLIGDAQGYQECSDSVAS